LFSFDLVFKLVTGNKFYGAKGGGTHQAHQSLIMGNEPAHLSQNEI